jgi:hypothetical protein
MARGSGEVGLGYVDLCVDFGTWSIGSESWRSLGADRGKALA